MNEFVLCENELPKEPYAPRYEIITRCCMFFDGECRDEPEYSVCRAIYEGNGLWREIVELDIPTEQDDSVYDEDYIVSAGMKVNCTAHPDYMKYGENADIKTGIDVVAYAPLADMPDLSSIKPMQID